MISTFMAISYLGHEEHEWDPANPRDMKKIKKFFADKLKAGFRAFALGEDGSSKQIKTFDEDAERIVMTAKKTVMFQPARGG